MLRMEDYSPKSRPLKEKDESCNHPGWGGGVGSHLRGVLGRTSYRPGSR